MFFLEIHLIDEETFGIRNKISLYEEYYFSYPNKDEFPTVLILTDCTETIDELSSFIKSRTSEIRFLLTTFDELSDKKYVTYISKLGKKRDVLSDIKVKILDPIWTSPFNNEKVRL
ncbi:hypothetical protein D3C72_1304800 [compost metagenome]